LTAGSLVVHQTAAQDQVAQGKLPLAGAGKNPFGLSKCLKDAFGDATVRYAGDDILPKVVFSPANAAKDFSMDDYNTARGIAYMGSRYVRVLCRCMFIYYIYIYIDIYIDEISKYSPFFVTVSTR